MDGNGGEFWQWKTLRGRLGEKPENVFGKLSVDGRLPKSGEVNL